MVRAENVRKNEGPVGFVGEIGQRLHFALYLRDKSSKKEYVEYVQYAGYSLPDHGR